MSDAPPPPRARTRARVVIEVLQLAVIAGALAVGIVLRFREMPERVVGGGLIGLALLLLIVWGRAAAGRARR